jgi:class 3 adenylate cyclase/tetratricopeptide (TPR) repeat protein
MQIHPSVIDAVKARVGTRIKQKWLVDSLLGVGGMGAVYAATHRNGNRVALKILHTQLSIDGDIRARFGREGYVANSVIHPGVVRVLDDDETEDGAAFLVMELLEGENAEARATRLGGRLPVDEVARLGADLLDVLAAAHAANVVHRDIKPENIFFTKHGELKVLDFGIARLRDGVDPASHTRTGVTMGTPSFMPPEQALGRVHEVDALSDVWAVGATMFALASGRMVHESTTSMEAVIAAATARARPIAQLAPDVPAELAAVIDRALEFQKSARWPSARAMQNALREAMPTAQAPSHAAPSAFSSSPPMSRSSSTIPAWAEERKVATVLFGDVVGLSDISSDLEPDAVRDFANEFFEPLSREVEREGGTVVKYIGDCMMAVFGVPVTREGDAERAVRAALTMSHRVREIAKKHGHDIALRVGINTGLVMVGTVGAGARAVPDIMGATVTLAGRIENAANPGEIVVGPGTERVIRSRFELVEVGATKLKGINERVVLHRVIAERGDEVASSRQLRAASEVTFFGRHAELDLLLRAYDLVATEGGLRVVELTGELGQGKSYLLRSFRAAVASRSPPPLVFQTSRGSAVTPLGFLGRMLRAHFQIRADEAPAQVRERVGDGVASAWKPADVEDGREAGRLLAELVAPVPAAPLLGTELAGDRTRTASAFADWIRRIAAVRPVCLTVEQVQWTDDASLDLLQFLIRALRRAAVLIILSARPQTSEQIPAWLTGCDVRTQIRLAPFSPEVMGRFLDELFRNIPNFPRELKSEIVERSEGNPQFCKELVRLLVDRGAVVVDDAHVPIHWEKARSSKLVLPDTVLGVLHARLDGLPVAQKELLKLASVVGRVFWLGALESLVGNATAEEISGLVDGLAAREFVRANAGSSLTGEREFTFTTLHDAAYELLPRSARTAVHRQVAEWLLGRGELWEGGNADLATHLDAAGDHPAARRHYLNAARHAVSVHAYHEALTLFARMNASWPEATTKDDRLHRAGVHRECAAAASRIGRFENALQSLERAKNDLAIADVPGIDIAYCWIALERGLILKEYGRVEASIEALSEGLELGKSHPPGLLHMRLHSARAFQRATKGDRPHAKEDCDQGLHIGQSMSVRDFSWHVAMARLKDAEGTLHVYDGKLDAAEVAYRSALEHREVAGDPQGMQDAFVNLGGIAFNRKGFASAIGYYEKALASARKARWSSREALGHSNLGQAKLAAGEAESAIAELELACSLAEEGGYLDTLADSVRALSEARLASGAIDSAIETALLAVRHGEQSGNPYFEAMAHGVAMDAYLAKAEASRDRSVFEDAVLHREAAVSLFRDNKQPHLADIVAQRFGRGSNLTVNT